MTLLTAATRLAVAARETIALFFAVPTRLAVVARFATGDLRVALLDATARFATGALRDATARFATGALRDATARFAAGAFFATTL